MRTLSGLLLFFTLLVLLLSGCATMGPSPTATEDGFVDEMPRPTESPTPRPPTTTPTGTATSAPPPPEPAPALQPTGPAPTLPAGSKLDVAFIQMIDRERGWAIGGLNRGRDHILYTADGARSFRDVTPPIGQPAVQATELWAVGSFVNEDTAFVLFFPAIQEPSPPGGADVVIWRTNDAGKTWGMSEVISSSVLGTRDFQPRLAFINPDRGWFMARNGGAGMHRYPISLYHTHDGGITWELLVEAIGGSELQSCRKTDWAFGGLLTGLATIDNCPVNGPTIEVTYDGGSTWERILLPPPEENPQTVLEAYCETGSPQFISENEVLLSASCTAYQEVEVQRDLLFRSSDGGESWQVRDYPGGELQFLDEARGFALGREIYWTMDGGATWERQKTVNWDGQFSFVDPEYGWAVARAEGELALVVTQDRAQSWQILEPTLAP